MSQSIQKKKKEKIVHKGKTTKKETKKKQKKNVKKGKKIIVG